MLVSSFPVNSIHKFTINIITKYANYLNREDYAEKCLPTHPCLSLLANSEQPLSKVTSRRLLTYEKTRHPSVDEEDIEHTTIQDFRNKYFLVREETRKEKREREAALRKEHWQKYVKSKATSNV